METPVPAQHLEASRAWRPGQIWETRIIGLEHWVNVSEQGRAQPLWDRDQEYRMVERRAP